MNITELKGEKTVKALAKRLLEPAAGAKSAKASSESELEAALLRLNPHLQGIADLEKGTPVLVPDTFALVRGESTAAGSGAGTAEDLLREAGLALESLRAALENSLAETGAEAERVQSWLKGGQAKEILERQPELKEAFGATAAAAKNLRKEHAALIAAEEKELDKLQAALASFRAPPPSR